jgi:hypothetical protein
VIAFIVTSAVPIALLIAASVVAIRVGVTRR